MDYTTIAANQIQIASKKIESFLKQKTGKSFKLQPTMLKRGGKTVQAKFTMRKGKNMKWLDYWPMFLLQIEYEPGHDLYNVETEYWDDIKRGRPVFMWSANLIYTDQALDPDVVFPFANKVKDRLKKGIGKGETGAANKLMARNQKNKRLAKKKVEIKFPRKRVKKTVGRLEGYYTVYHGKEGKMENFPNSVRQWVERVFYLTGPKGGKYFLYIYKNGQYALLKGSKTVYKGTMTDRTAPEIVAK